MKSVCATLALFLALCSASLEAQQPGVSSEWDIRKTLEAIAAHARRLQPLLEQIEPQTWVAKGAAESYVTQWNASRTQAAGLAQAAQNLSREPEKLAKALETFFRVQSLELMLSSLGEAIRKYQNPALADLLAGVVAENGANRERLQQYILDLATEKEQEFQVADREAQRCRAFLFKQPAPRRSEKPGSK